MKLTEKIIELAFPSIEGKGPTSVREIPSRNKMPGPRLASLRGPQNRLVNVFCAGDDDQSIYAWRGAQVELMRRFRFDFPGATIVRFDVSYRLSDPLCRAASSVVKGLPGHVDKRIRSHLSNQEVDPTRILGDILGGTIGEDGWASPEMESGQILQQQLNKNKEMKIDMDCSIDNRYDNVEIALAEAPAAITVRKMATEEQELEHIVRDIRDKLQTAKERQNDGGSYQEPSGTKSRERFIDGKESTYRSRGYGAWVLPAGTLLNVLRLIAVPNDDVAFEAALDNDIILTAYQTRTRGNTPSGYFDWPGTGLNDDVDVAGVRNVIATSYSSAFSRATQPEYARRSPRVCA